MACTSKLTKVSAKARFSDIKRDKDAFEERTLLESYLELAEQESSASKTVKDAAKALDAKVAAKYNQLAVTDIKTLVVNDKWLTPPSCYC
jgi:type I restriction enzyme M protein